MTRVEYWKRRAAVAESKAEFQVRENVHTLAWAERREAEHRRLADRCTYLYGLAIHLGATEEQLRKGWPNNEARPA